jgi:hypothetical protein
VTARHAVRSFLDARYLLPGDVVHCGGHWRSVEVVEQRKQTVYVRFLNGESTVYARSHPVWTERQVP